VSRTAARRTPDAWARAVPSWRGSAALAELWFDTRQIHLFDATTGRNLLATDEGAPSRALPRAAA
jgi:hypothetical protein